MKKKFKSSEVIYYDNLEDYYRNASCTSLSVPSRVLKQEDVEGKSIPNPQDDVQQVVCSPLYLDIEGYYFFNYKRMIVQRMFFINY